jgi:hypothetical protein
LKDFEKLEAESAMDWYAGFIQKLKGKLKHRCLRANHREHD